MNDAATIDPTSGVETPSAALTAAASREVIVTDERGRTFTLKKPGVLAQFDLIDALGETAKNQVFMGMVFPLLFVAAIDGAVVVKPGSRAELNALIERLDDDGIQAVMTGVTENFGATDEAAVKNV